MGKPKRTVKASANVLKKLRLKKARTIQERERLDKAAAILLSQMTRETKSDSFEKSDGKNVFEYIRLKFREAKLRVEIEEVSKKPDNPPLLSLGITGLGFATAKGTPSVGIGVYRAIEVADHFDVYYWFE